MEILFTRDDAWLKKWDAFVIQENKATHLLLSDWVKTYETYGFEYEFCLVLEQNAIVGGYAAVVAKAFVFKFYIVPFGPIIVSGFENQLNELIDIVRQRAVFHDSCYSHISLSFSAISNPHVFIITSNLEALKNAKKGHLFQFIYSSKGLNWIDLKGFSDAESKINSLKPSVRRNIRNSYRKGLELQELNTIEKLEKGYLLFLENAKMGNYTIRDWKDVKESFVALLDKGVLIMLGAFKNGDLKGAILLMKSGNYFTYILGGSKKENPDLRTGDFLQWEAIKLSMEKGFDGYNISLGGSKGVMDFKNSFNTCPILFEQSQYHWVLKPFYVRVFLFFEKRIRPYKKQVSKMLSIAKKIK